MHFDDHESQVPVSSSALRFQHLTMPVREKRDTSGLITRTQKPSGSQVAPSFTGKERREQQRSAAEHVSIHGVQGRAYAPEQFSPSGWYPSDVTAPLPSWPWANASMAPTLPQNGVADPYMSGVELAPALEKRLKPAYQNGYPGQAMPFDMVIPIILPDSEALAANERRGQDGLMPMPYPARMAEVPNFTVLQLLQHNGAGAIQQGLWNQHNILLDASDSGAKKHSLLFELPHLIGYMIGMMAIFGLYLIIPMMILLNATLPGSWNKLMIAAGILAIGEIAICVILVKTIPRRKSKHKQKTHRRDALARPYQHS
jgi:hypothetical protein